MVSRGRDEVHGHVWSPSPHEVVMIIFLWVNFPLEFFLYSKIQIYITLMCFLFNIDYSKIFYLILLKLWDIISKKCGMGMWGSWEQKMSRRQILLNSWLMLAHAMLGFLKWYSKNMLPSFKYPWVYWTDSHEYAVTRWKIFWRYDRMTDDLILR